MKRSAFLGAIDVVRDFNLYCIPPISFDDRSRKLVIDYQNAFIIAIWRFETSRDCEIVRACHPGIREISIRIGLGGCGTPGKSIRQGLQSVHR